MKKSGIKMKKESDKLFYLNKLRLNCKKKPDNFNKK